MKRIVDVTKNEAGFESMLGEKIFLYCARYFYAGTLTGVNSDHIELSNAQIVFNAGEMTEKTYRVSERLPGDKWRVMIAAVESWGTAKC